MHEWRVQALSGKCCLHKKQDRLFVLTPALKPFAVDIKTRECTTIISMTKDIKATLGINLDWTTGVHIIAILLLFASAPKFLTADRRANISLPCKGNRKVKSGK
jgi:hypothetical protein